MGFLMSQAAILNFSTFRKMLRVYCPSADGFGVSVQRKKNKQLPYKNKVGLFPSRTNGRPQKKTAGRGSLLNRPSCPADDLIGQGTELN